MLRLVILQILYIFLMKTQPIYLEDSYQQEMDGVIENVLDESEGRYRLILDKTVFYPMGGGQSTDQGILECPEGKMEVYMVMMKDGEINHYVKAIMKPEIGQRVHGKINWERRYGNMRKHSAGHVVDFALYLLGYSPKTLLPLKGDHDKKPQIVYQGSVDTPLQEEIEKKANELVAQNISFSWAFKPLDEVEKQVIYLQPGLPANKPLRILTLEGVGSVADGGTQVHQTAEIGHISITQIDVHDGQTIVFYSIA